MKNSWFGYLVTTLSLIIALFVLMGSFCNTRGTLRTIRTVHVQVRSSFVLLDSTVAPMLETAGDRCSQEVENTGATGQQAMDAWHQCMNSWNDLRVAIHTSRELLASLEDVYEDIETGSERSWKSIAVRVLHYGRDIVNILVDLGVPVPEGFVDAIESICTVTNCEGETDVGTSASILYESVPVVFAMAGGIG